MKKMLDNQQKVRIYRLHIGHWRLVLANCRLKKMNPAQAGRDKSYCKAVISAKRLRYRQNGGVCEICGKPLTYGDAEIHHVLPFSQFPQYGSNPDNMLMACQECHHAIHHNPYVNLRRMEEKARELGFNLMEYYQGKYNPQTV